MWLFSRKKQSNPNKQAGSQKNSQTLSLDDLLLDTEAALKAFVAGGQSGEELLAALGVSRQVATKAALVDSEVASCREDLRSAMNQSAWRLYGEDADDAHIDRLWKVIKKHLPTLTELVLSAKLSGFSVGEYIYKVEEDGFITIDKIRNKSGNLDAYSVKYSGELIKQGDKGEEVLDTELKYSLLINNPTDDEPAGDMTVARLFPALMLRQHGMRFAMQFVKRYAQPLIIGKTAGDKTVLRDDLYALNSGGAAAIDHDDDISLLTLSGDGNAFGLLEKLANAQIQKLLLGRVKTGDLANGSRSAQETEESTRIERINAYLALLSNAVSHLIDALIVVNREWGLPITAPNGLFFEFEKEIKIDLNRANRDKIYIDAGVFKPTKEYMTDILGIEEQHFELVSSEELAVSSERLSGSLKRLFSHKTPAWLLPNRVRLAMTEQEDDEEITPTEQALIYPFLVKIFDALSRADTAEDFQAALNAMDLSEEENAIIATHLPEIVKAYLDGLNND